MSPVRTIASPRMLRGLALFKGIESPKNKVDYASSSSSLNGEINEDLANESREEIDFFEPTIFNQPQPPSLKKFVSAPDSSPT